MQYLYIAQFIMMVVGPIVRYVFQLIGLGFVTFVGFNALVGVAKDYIIDNMSGAPLAVINILGLAKVDVAVSIFFSAVTTRLIIAGVNKATDRKRAQVWNPPGRDYIDA